MFRCYRGNGRIPVIKGEVVGGRHGNGRVTTRQMESKETEGAEKAQMTHAKE
jgi:hypothetical protein